MKRPVDAADVSARQKQSSEDQSPEDRLLLQLFGQLRKPTTEVHAEEGLADSLDRVGGRTQLQAAERQSATYSLRISELAPRRRGDTAEARSAFEQLEQFQQQFPQSPQLRIAFARAVYDLLVGQGFIRRADSDDRMRSTATAMQEVWILHRSYPGDEDLQEYWQQIRMLTRAWRLHFPDEWLSDAEEGGLDEHGDIVGFAYGYVARIAKLAASGQATSDKAHAAFDQLEKWKRQFPEPLFSVYWAEAVSHLIKGNGFSHRDPDDAERATNEAVQEVLALCRSHPQERRLNKYWKRILRSLSPKRRQFWEQQQNLDLVSPITMPEDAEPELTGPDRGMKPPEEQDLNLSKRVEFHALAEKAFKRGIPIEQFEKAIEAIEGELAATEQKAAHETTDRAAQGKARPEAALSADASVLMVTREMLGNSVPPSLQTDGRQKYEFTPELFDDPQLIKAEESIANKMKYKIRRKQPIAPDERARGNLAKAFLGQLRTRQQPKNG